MDNVQVHIFLLFLVLLLISVVFHALCVMVPRWRANSQGSFMVLMLSLMLFLSQIITINPRQEPYARILHAFFAIWMVLFLSIIVLEFIGIIRKLPSALKKFRHPMSDINRPPEI